MRVLRKKRAIAWMSPAEGAFTVMFILGEKAMAEVRATTLPARVVRAYKEAPKYPEGTGIRLPVKSKTDLDGLLTLAAIKVAH